LGTGLRWAIALHQANPEGGTFFETEHLAPTPLPGRCWDAWCGGVGLILASSSGHANNAGGVRARVYLRALCVHARLLLKFLFTEVTASNFSRTLFQIGFPGAPPESCLVFVLSFCPRNVFCMSRLGRASLLKFRRVCSSRFVVEFYSELA
jgi:hypothetical protein